MSTDPPPPAQPTPEEVSQYESLKRDLVSALQKKRVIDKDLAQVEAQIFALETTYLQETAAHSSGNIIQGFEGYLKNQSSGRRKNEVHDNDRIFSASSLTYQKSIELLGEVDETAAPGSDELKLTNPVLTTVVVPPAPAEQMTPAQIKRAKDKEYARKKRRDRQNQSGTPAPPSEDVDESSPTPVNPRLIGRASKRTRTTAELD